MSAAVWSELQFGSDMRSHIYKMSLPSPWSSHINSVGCRVQKMQRRVLPWDVRQNSQQQRQCIEWLWPRNGKDNGCCNEDDQTSFFRQIYLFLWIDHLFHGNGSSFSFLCALFTMCARTPSDSSNLFQCSATVSVAASPSCPPSGSSSLFWSPPWRCSRCASTQWRSVWPLLSIYWFHLPQCTVTTNSRNMNMTTTSFKDEMHPRGGMQHKSSRGRWCMFQTNVHVSSRLNTTIYRGGTIFVNNPATLKDISDRKKWFLPSIVDRTNKRRRFPQHTKCLFPSFYPFCFMGM